MLITLFLLYHLLQTDAEKAERQAIIIEQQKLPEGITATPGTRQFIGSCDVCGEETEYDGNLLLECDNCRTQVRAASKGP